MSGSAVLAHPTPNAERLAQLYDPAYVHRVESLNAGMPVQVCLESRMLRDDVGTGVATYARVLARCLKETGASAILLDDRSGQGDAHRNRARRWLAATQRAPREAVARDPLGADRAAAWVVSDVFREAQVFFNLHGRLLPVQFAVPPEVMHWTYPVPLFVCGSKNLYTIHDLIPLTDPDLTPIPQGRHRRMLGQIAARAHGLITVSETMRRLVIDRLGVLPDKVTNTYQAVEAPLQSDPALPTFLRPGRYLLFCGRVEPRKNLERLAQAHRLSGAEMPLMIVGPAAAGEDRLEELLRGFPAVIRLPWVPRNELLGLIRGARALLFPSLAEGFGLPIVEAMTLGCPVLTANRGATAEIAGDAALLVSPESVEEIAAAILRLVGDDRLRASLRSAGFARGRFFAPDPYARRLRALYANALAGPAVMG